MATEQLTKKDNKKNPKDDDINIVAENIEDVSGKKEDKKEKKRKKGHGLLSKMVPILVLLVIIGSLVGILGFNLFDIRNRYLSDFLGNIPIVNNLIPLDTTPSDPDDPYSGMTRDELVAEIDRMMANEEKYQQEITELTEQNTQHIEEIRRLKEIEDQQLQFRADKAEFDRLIALNDPAAYAKFFESVSPENAAELYKQAISTVEYGKEFSRYVATIVEMEPSKAAEMLEQIIRSDMNLVTRVLSSVDKETSGAILDSMQTRNAASVFRMMVPTPVPALTNYPPTLAADTVDTAPVIAEPTASPVPVE